MKTNEEKLYQEYYQVDRVWTGGKAIKELIESHLYREKISGHC